MQKTSFGDLKIRGNGARKGKDEGKSQVGLAE